jgi:hypothetical protein
MAALYAHDGVLETPAVLALWPEREDAVVHGRDAIAQFFAQSFQARSGEGVFEDWFRRLGAKRLGQGGGRGHEGPA